MKDVPLVLHQVTPVAPVVIAIHFSIQIPVSIHVQMDSMETPQIGNAKVKD